ncbi:MAG: methylmalonyl-CoA mutase family protein, partial [Polyangiales bacterium]
MSNTDERMNPFPPVSKSAWLAKVEADLKGASPDRLRSKTAGGLDIEPLYTAEDAVAPDAGFPGVYPYVRGATPLARWVVRQEYDDPRPSVCKAQIAQDLGRGVEALWLRIGPRHGCRVLTTENLDDVLGATDLGATSVYVEGGSDALAVAAGFLAVAERRGV